MDIPQQPKPINASQLNQSKSTQQAAKTPATASIKELNLKPDKIYQAIVSKIDIKASDAITPKSKPDSGSPPSVPQTIPQTTQTTAPEKSPTSSIEWLLKVNGKLLLVSSDRPLKAGQTLAVKLDDNQSGLSVIATPTLSSLQKASSASTNPNSRLLDNQSVATLLNAVNQVMPRQVSLHTGLKALEIISNQSESKLVSTQAKTVLSALLTRALDKQTLPPLTNKAASSDPKSGGIAIQNALKNSGLLFETSIKTRPELTSGIKQQIIGTQQALSRLSTQLSASPLPTGSNTNNARILPKSALAVIEKNMANTKSVSPLLTPGDKPLIQNKTGEQSNSIRTLNPDTGVLHSSSPRPVHSSLQTAIQNQLQTLLKTGSAAADASTAAQQDKLNTDLKGALFSLTAALRTTGANSKLPALPYVDALAQLDLLNSPFNFPHIASQTRAKAESILADQQFSTGQLLKLIAGMLNRIQFNQLNSLYQSYANTSETTNLQTLFMELPVVNTQNQLSTFDVRIDREEENKADEKESKEKEIQWRLSLSFDFEQLGPIYIQATLIPPSISTTIWATKPETLSLINHEKVHFQKSLEALGLNIGELRCQKGQPTQHKAKLDRSLVDIKA